MLLNDLGFLLNNVNKIGTGYAAFMYKGATVLSNIHPIVIVIDDVGIVLSCDIQDDFFLHD